MKKLYILMWIWFPLALCSGQNLMTNPSFDQLSLCPSSYSQITRAVGWRSNSTGFAGDLMNTCSSSSYSRIPNSIYVGNQFPRTGNGYVGLLSYANSGSDPREYACGTLSSALVAGTTYDIEFFVNASDYSAYDIGNFGVYFSTTPLAIANTAVVGLTAHAEYVGPRITSTTAWIPINLTYTATGGERYMSISNFRSRATTNAVSSGHAGGSVGPYAYYLIEDVTVTPGAVLPVSLLSFTGKEQQNANLINWETSLEVTNDHFLLERSENGVDFQPLAEIPGAGTSDEAHSYDYLDETTEADINYYRLRITDFNGQFTYSQILTLGSVPEENIDITLFPNPATDHFSFRYQGNEEMVSVKVFDLFGKQLISEDLEARPYLSVNTEELQAGVYLVRVRHGAYESTKRLVVK